MNGRNILALGAAVCLCASLLTGCGDKAPEVDFSGIRSVCQLATLKCYYHNVAKAEKEAGGTLKVFGVGYKKIWTEYSGVVELGIDVNQVTISGPNQDGVVQVFVPDAEIVSVDLDEESLGEPVTDTGFLTKITKEEETAALAAAQDNMETEAKDNQALLDQAKERAKRIIEGYIRNVVTQMGKTYTVEWVQEG